MPDLVLHVGLMKSGTTSIQHMLSAHRGRDASWCYPDTGQFNQMLCFVPLLRTDEHALERMPAGLLRHLESLPDLSGLLDSLESQVASSQADRVVVSAENLIYAGPRTLTAIGERLARDKSVSVVITTRRGRDLVPSNYQQQARIAPVPDFDEWARLELGRMCEQPARGSLASLRRDDMTVRWGQLGDVRFVDMTADRQASLRDAWRELTGSRFPAGEGVTPGDAGVNSSFTADRITAIQRFRMRHPQLTIAEVREVVQAASSEAGSGVGRWMLTERCADLVDAACLGGEGARSELAELTRSGQPVGMVVDVGSDDVFDDAVIHQLRQFDRANRKLRARRLYRRFRDIRR